MQPQEALKGRCKYYNNGELTKIKVSKFKMRARNLAHQYKCLPGKYEVVHSILGARKKIEMSLEINRTIKYD